MATVDKYQGQQNEYVLLSLVRTRAVGHLRDVRRLIVAFSRARLGLYIFGRASVFANCYELQPAFRCMLVASRLDASTGTVRRSAKCLTPYLMLFKLCGSVGANN